MASLANGAQRGVPDDAGARRVLRGQRLRSSYSYFLAPLDPPRFSEMPKPGGGVLGQGAGAGRGLVLAALAMTTEYP